MNYLDLLENIGLTPDTRDTSRTDQELIQDELQAKGIAFRVTLKKKRRAYPPGRVLEDTIFAFVAYHKQAQGMSGDMKTEFNAQGSLIACHCKLHQ